MAVLRGPKLSRSKVGIRCRVSSTCSPPVGMGTLPRAGSIGNRESADKFSPMSLSQALTNGSGTSLVDSIGIWLLRNAAVNSSISAHKCATSPTPSGPHSTLHVA